MTASDGLTPRAILADLVRIPSVSSMSNRPVIEFARRMLQPRGWRFRELPYHDASGVEKVNLLAVPPTQNPDNFSVDLALVCHTDTVPYRADWAQAVNPVVIDGALHGCGACDVKGFLACLLAVLASVPAPRFAHSIALVLTAEEEVGCLGAARLLAEGLLQARHVLIGEPTSLHPARAGKGYCLAEIRVLGKAAHSAHPAQGASAIFRAARLITQIEHLALSLRERSPRDVQQLFDPPYTTLNVGTIEGGTAKNIVPAECRFLLEWRPLPGEDPNLIPNKVQAVVEQLRSEDPDFTCEIQVLRQQAGFATSADSPLMRRWTQLSGRSALAVPFSTEAPLLAALAEDVVVAGPGDMRTAHSDRECVPLIELDECAACLWELATRPLEAPQ